MLLANRTCDTHLPITLITSLTHTTDKSVTHLLETSLTHPTHKQDQCSTSGIYMLVTHTYLTLAKCCHQVMPTSSSTVFSLKAGTYQIETERVQFSSGPLCSCTSYKGFLSPPPYQSCTQTVLTPEPQRCP